MVLVFCLFVMEQIVTLGMPNVSPIEEVGKYVSPREWNELITDPDTVSNTNTFQAKKFFTLLFLLMLIRSNKFVPFFFGSVSKILIST